MFAASLAQAQRRTSTRTVVAPRQASAAPMSARQIAARVLPSVVLVVTSCGRGSIVFGSGFVVSRGIIATNKHVVECGSRSFVSLVNSAVRHSVTARWLDSAHDLALLRVEDLRAPVLALSDVRNLSIGDTVYAAGNPQGLQGTFSNGIISSLRYAEGEIQFTAPISKGSSGGPVVDEHGRVIGITVSYVGGGQSLNFAVPSLYLRTLLNGVQRGALPTALIAAEEPRPQPIAIAEPLRLIPDGAVLFASPRPSDAVYRRGEVDRPVEITEMPQPLRTRESSRTSGTVRLRAVFRPTGEVTDITVLRGLPHGLSWCAVKAARAIRFRPAVKNNRSVAMSMTLEYAFALNGAVGTTEKRDDTSSPDGNLAVESPSPARPALADAESLFINQNYNEVIAVSRDLLAATPDHPRANLLLGSSYYKLKQYDQAVAPLLKAIMLGEEARLPVAIHRRVLVRVGASGFDNELRAGEIIVRRGGVEFVIGDASQRIRVPFNKVYEVVYERDKAEQLTLKVGVQQGGREERVTYRFHPAEATVESKGLQGYPEASRVSCSACSGATKMIYNLLIQLRQTFSLPNVRDAS